MTGLAGIFRNRFHSCFQGNRAPKAVLSLSKGPNQVLLTLAPCRALWLISSIYCGWQGQPAPQSRKWPEMAWFGRKNENSAFRNPAAMGRPDASGPESRRDCPGLASQVFLICVDITATAFCHCPSFPRKRESREFVRSGFPQTRQADSRFRGNDRAENSLSTYVKNTASRLW